VGTRRPRDLETAVPVLNPGRYRQWVDLDAPVGPAIAFAPARVKCLIRPGSPGAFDEDKTTHVVETPYHPQITMNTRLTFVDRAAATHCLHVRGIQNVDMLNRDLVLLCEEVMVP
jgi:hypothetical protein